MAIEANGVTRRFAGLLALDNVTLSLAPGEIVGLIGPNGSGKTTLLNVVSGTLRSSGGRVLVDGTDVTGWSPHNIARCRVARTFQNIRLYTNLSVRENVEVGAALAAKSGNLRVRSRALLRRLDLDPLALRAAGTLSYGEQRRLEIARAMATDPRYLLLDEPAAGMSERESGPLLSQITGLRDETGIGLLVVDHDPALLMRFCDRIVVLNEGRVISEGRPAEVRADPVVIEAYLGAPLASDEGATQPGPTNRPL